MSLIFSKLEQCYILYLDQWSLDEGDSAIGGYFMFKTGDTLKPPRL